MEPHHSRKVKGKSASEARHQDLPSPHSSSTIEFNIGRKGSLHKLPSPHSLKSSASFDIGLSPPTSPPETPNFTESSPLKSPGHPTDYDPNRIPSSIFSSKPTNPSEWSAASNDSLFSIHMGNSSFTRDYSNIFGNSGELNKLDDWNTSPYNPVGHPGDFPRLEEWDQLRSAAEANANESSSLTPAKNEDRSSSPVVDHLSRTPPPEAPTSPSAQRFSNDSGRSFAFPVLVSNSLNTDKENPETPQTKPPPVQPKPEVELVQSSPQTEPKSAPPDPKAALNAVSGTTWCPCPCLPCLPRWC